jgi:hypothetical protein
VWVEPAVRAPLRPAAAEAAAVSPVVAARLRCVRFFAANGSDGSSSRSSRAGLGSASAKYFRRDVQPNDTVAELAAAVAAEFADVEGSNGRGAEWRAAVGLRGAPLRGDASEPLAVGEGGETFWALAPARTFAADLWARQADLAAFVYRSDDGEDDVDDEG